jgi:hypothetical protein
MFSHLKNRKSIDKSSHPLVINTLNELRLEMNFYSLISAIYKAYSKHHT